MGQLFESWKDITPQLFSIFLTMIVICSLCIVYNVKIRNLKDGEELSGFLVLTETFIGMMENIVVTTMGKKFRHLTPFAMYIFLYILVSSIISLLGFEPLSSSYTVTLSMAIVSFFGIYYYGLRYQKFMFFMKFALNPIEVITQFVPILSLSFRLFGNILAGATILGLLYGAFTNLWGSFFGAKSEDGTGIAHDIWDETNLMAQYKYFWTGFNLLSVMILPILHLYFDLFDGVIQSIVFTMLTFSYWANAKNGEHESGPEPTERESDKKVAKKASKKDLLSEPVAVATAV
ncbi:F0F1 ATP synthase subunit A [Spiroplasma tabanidicola]|uniref:F0F1 ATP synthase subunit A n=1 Tax=Spiroplasma tabanidicola TaxID=324079 RepID=A0A6I6C5T4_9MOLU|nr:F0F1 ATP synthase subunit A [Spiroplasma tabanidicola]QGS51500.1 F0F1 ATP synthase subunit A [Spiroplasma tabanidicola]